MCCEHRNIRWLPEPHVNLTGFHRLKQCRRWWRFHSNRLSVVRESFLGWLWFAAQSGLSEKSLPVLFLKPPLRNHVYQSTFLPSFSPSFVSSCIRYLHSECSSLLCLPACWLFPSSHPLFLDLNPLIHQFLLFKSLSFGIKLMPAAVNLS